MTTRTHNPTFANLEAAGDRAIEAERRFKLSNSRRDHQAWIRANERLIDLAVAAIRSPHRALAVKAAHVCGIAGRELSDKVFQSAA